ncbi:MAG: ATP-binding cassette domain-containing protein, partial [Methanobacteriales archaeon]|nr:ATP-binding cassette domain-containing protein [Methanobacteriales archaeon]
MLLEITDLAVEVEGKEVLEDIDLYIDKGETHVLLGPNGSGKSTLFMTILGFPKYKVKKGEIIFKGKDITELPTTERVRMGIGVSFQNPPPIRGVKLIDLLKIENGQTVEEELNPEIMETA